MHQLLVFAFLLAQPFWETKAPNEWDDQQLLDLMTDSPWVYNTTFSGASEQRVYLATAKPMRDGEAEMIRRYTKRNPLQPPPESTAREEYEAFLRENPGKVIVIAIRNPNLKALAEAEEVRHMEEESILKVDKKKIKANGHFPPGANDPVLRLVFPKPETLGKELNFELYIPGVTGPYRQAIFRIKDLTYHGKPEL
jgi:hypothetical protein